jgi:hypothetical protein
LARVWIWWLGYRDHGWIVRGLVGFGWQVWFGWAHSSQTTGLVWWQATSWNLTPSLNNKTIIDQRQEFMEWQKRQCELNFSLIRRSFKKQVKPKCRIGSIGWFQCLLSVVIQY